MEAVCFSETLLFTYETTCHRNPEEHSRPRRYKSLRSHKIYCLSKSQICLSATTQTSDMYDESKVKLPRYSDAGDNGEKQYSSYSFFTSALDGGVWSASRPGRSLPPGKDPGTHCTGDWVSPRACLDTEAREKSFTSA
jgi:hypothetical protein